MKAMCWSYYEYATMSLYEFTNSIPQVSVYSTYAFVIEEVKVDLFVQNSLYAPFCPMDLCVSQKFD